MAISTGQQGHGTLFTEINITPLTDIFLVLLIIMMVIAPMLQSNRADIKIPKIKSGQGVSEAPLTVEITKAGDYFINGNPATALALTETLRPLLASTPDKTLVLRADSDTKSKDVLAVYDAASQAGFEKLTVAGEPLGQAEQAQLNQKLQEAPASP